MADGLHGVTDQRRRAAFEAFEAVEGARDADVCSVLGCEGFNAVFRGGFRVWEPGDAVWELDLVGFHFLRKVSVAGGKK